VDWAASYLQFSEATPLVLGLVLGIFFGTQYGGKLDSKTAVTILLLGLGAALVLGAFPYFSLVQGGSFESLPIPWTVVSFANSYIGAVVGLLIGKLASRRA
jgi:hypothetical protein